MYRFGSAAQPQQYQGYSSRQESIRPKAAPSGGFRHLLSSIHTGARLSLRGALSPVSTPPHPSLWVPWYFPSICGGAVQHSARINQGTDPRHHASPWQWLLGGSHSWRLLGRYLHGHDALGRSGYGDTLWGYRSRNREPHCHERGSVNARSGGSSQHPIRVARYLWADQRYARVARGAKPSR